MVVKKSSTEAHQINQNAIQDFLDHESKVGGKIFTGTSVFLLHFFCAMKKKWKCRESEALPKPPLCPEFQVSGWRVGSIVREKDFLAYFFVPKKVSKARDNVPVKCHSGKTQSKLYRPKKSLQFFTLILKRICEAKLILKLIYNFFFLIITSPFFFSFVK